MNAETNGGLCPFRHCSLDVYRAFVITTIVTGKGNKCGKVWVYEWQNSLYNWHIIGHQDDK